MISMTVMMKNTSSRRSAEVDGGIHVHRVESDEITVILITWKNIHGVAVVDISILQTFQV